MSNLEMNRLLSEEHGYIEPFLRMLGAEEICSIDASPYEGASFIHDMNLPIPSQLKNNFTVVIDGGSLEHIFDYPRGVKNVMEMVRVGGHFLGINPTNGCMGHGFYQFSPELYFRIFAKDNGFSVERIFLFESLPKAKWYEVNDPERVRKRVGLINVHPTHMLIQAKKLNSVPIFTSSPKQSDYVALWSGDTNSYEYTIDRKRKLMQNVLKVTGQRTTTLLLNIYRSIRAITKLRFSSEFFKEVDIAKLFRGGRSNRAPLNRKPRRSLS